MTRRPRAPHTGRVVPDAAVRVHGLALACALALVACARPLTHATLRAELERHTCAVWSPEAGVWSLQLFDPACAPTSSPHEPGPLVRASVARLQPFPLLAEAAYDHFYAPQTDRPTLAPPAAQSLADAAVWSDPLLSSAVWSAVHSELRARRLTCRDCPGSTPPSPVTVTWAEFYPYLAAYIHPAQPPDGPVAIYVCSGTNGAAALPHNDTLLRVGRLTATAFALDPSAARQIRDLNHGELAEVKQALHSHLQGPTGRAFACEALADLAWFTGLRVRDCVRPRSRRPAPG